MDLIWLTLPDIIRKAFHSSFSMYSRHKVFYIGGSKVDYVNLWDDFSMSFSFPRLLDSVSWIMLCIIKCTTFMPQLGCILLLIYMNSLSSLLCLQTFRDKSQHPIAKEIVSTLTRLSSRGRAALDSGSQRHSQKWSRQHYRKGNSTMFPHT